MRGQWFRIFAMALIAITAIGAMGGILYMQVFQAHAATNGPALTVDAAADRHAISRDIYGMNMYGVDAMFAQQLHIPVQRWGGDATSRYNWQVDSSNAGGDWYFMGGNGQANPTPGASADQFIVSNQQAGSQTLLTIPIINYINKMSQTNCSYPVSAYGQQQSTNPYVHPNGDSCGNGINTAGNHITDNNIGLNNIANSPAFQQAWIQHLISQHGTASQGGVGIYELDNEPSGWGNTHRDIHPGPTGYDELVNLSTQYAAMIKATDPTAMVDGPGDFGYAAYIGAGAPGDNAQSHGVGLAEYYLQQMYKYQQQHGVRLLDYFDEHYYPSSSDACIANCPAGDANTQAERLQSTRSLWDPTYKDNSWIGQYYPPIQLIPMFHSWVNKDYPGTKIAISEYNFGGLESINGALTEADVLGIFGRQQLDLATLWGPPQATQPGAYAFRMYLNYDGNGSSYGDTWVQSASSDQSQLAIYSAQRSSDGALTLMVINKTANDLTSNLGLSNFAPSSQAQVYTYSSANLNAIVRQPNLSVSGSGFTTTYPANSITLVVLPKSGTVVTPNPTATIATTATVNPTATTTVTASPTATSTPSQPPVTIPATFNNKGVTTSSDRTAANYDGAGNSYPGDLLQQAGFSSGATFTTHGMKFQLPTFNNTSYDNWLASGQAIPLTGTGHTLAFLGSATNGPATGTATITYTDGTIQHIQLAFSDWTLGMGNEKPLANNAIVLKFPYRDTRTGTQNHQPCIFFTSFKLKANKTIQSVTLPTSTSPGGMHVFAISIA